MRTFLDVKEKMGLKRFLGSKLGTLYFSPIKDLPKIMVRHFDSELPPSFVEPYANMVEAVHSRVKCNSPLSEFIQIEQIMEIGEDFIVRPYHFYYSSTRAYSEWEDPPEPPEKLAQMRHMLYSETAMPGEKKDRIIKTILKRSLLKPTGKTYFKESTGKFVVVEPKIEPEDVWLWVDDT